MMAMDEQLTMWSLLVGFASPLVISVVQQPRWSPAARAIVTAVICLILGAGTAWFQGDVTGTSVTSAVLTVLVASVSTYRSLWKPTGIAPAIETGTSPTPGAHAA